MAVDNLKVSKEDVQVLFNDSEAVRKMIEEKVQELVLEEFESHMGRSRYERDQGRETHRNGFKDRTIFTRVGKIYLRIPQTRDGSFSPSVYTKYQRVEKALFLTLVETHRQGVATRKIQKVTEELCGDKVPGSTFSAWNKSLDRELSEFRERPLEGDYPFVIVDAQVHKLRRNRSIVTEAALTAVGISASGHREVIGLAMGNSENEHSWREFFLSLKKRGLKGVRMVISDDHVGLVTAARMCFQGCTWQRCQYHFGKNVRSHLPRRLHGEISGRLKSIWEAPDRATSDILISRLLEDYRHYKGFDEWFEENVEDCLAVFEQPPSHRRRLRTTNGIERMNEEIRRRTEPLRIFPSREGAMRMLTALWEDIHESWIT